MSGADSIDFSGQIRKVCPAGAIGFRLTDTRTSPSTTYPIKATPRDYYLITDEVVEFPSAAPPGSYRVQFIESNGKTMIQGKAIRVLVVDESDGEQPDSKAEEGTEDSSANEDAADIGYSDEDDERISAKDERKYQNNVRELLLRKSKIQIAKLARHTQEIAEVHSHLGAMFDDSVNRLLRIDEVSQLHHDAQLKITTALSKKLTDIPHPPPPPQDWAGLLRTGIEGIKDVITAALYSSRGKDDKHISELVDAVEDRQFNRRQRRRAISSEVSPKAASAPPVSYTHLTLPTSDLV